MYGDSTDSPRRIHGEINAFQPLFPLFCKGERRFWVFETRLFSRIETTRVLSQ